MPPEKSQRQLPYIDCVRGYAILMVITSHVAQEFPALPYPVHRLTVSGWYGVQLFFLASCLTLLMSWNLDLERNGTADATAFFIRRVFRIVPAYYAAGVFYYFFSPPRGGFDMWQAISTATFVNAWSPQWTSTVPSAWYVVPGGWSISVEFSFYLLFPIFATWVISLRRAIYVLLGSIAFGLVANKAALFALSGSYLPVEIDNFLFFWFPNQMSVFALGGVLFFLVNHQTSRGSGWRETILRHPSVFEVVALGAFCALAFVSLGHYLGASPIVPASLAVSLPLMALIIGMSTGRGLLVNHYAAAMGQVSFSAYLLHFAVLHLFEAFPNVLYTRATGFGAIAAFVVGLGIVVAITYAVSWVSHLTIERPMINAGKSLIRARRALQFQTQKAPSEST